MSLNAQYSGVTWCNGAAMADDGAGKDNSGEKKQALGEVVKAESMIQLAIALPAGCLIGWLVGEWLDKHFQQHWIGIVGIVLGAIAGFLQIFTTASRYLKGK
jgi:F0F1-type ATP synthase assembly protein I